MRTAGAPCVRVRHTQSALVTAVGAITVVVIPGAVILVSLGVRQPTVYWTVLGLLGGSVALPTLVRVSVDMSPAGIVVRNGLSTHRVAWRDIGSLSASWWYRSPSFVVPGCGVLVVTTVSGRKFGIDASAGSMTPILTALERYAPGGRSQINHLLTNMRIR